MAKKKAAADKTTVEPKEDATLEARESFNRITELWNRDRERYRADTKFLWALEHWPEATKRQRDGDERLSLVVDKLGQYVHQVVNNSRQNRPQIKVRPIDNDADIATAEMLDGLCRHIQEQSNADICYDIALENACGGGFGYFRLLHDYAHADTFDQEIRFSPIPNSLQVYFGECKEPDGSDVQEVFICEDIDREEFKRDHPDIDATDWDTDGGKYGDWCGDKIRVAERYRIVKVDRILHLLDNGTTATDDDYQLAVANGIQVPAIKDSRNIPVPVVKWSKFCGSGYIDEEVDTVWDGIPVIPVWGNLQNIDGEVRHISMVHSAKDAQLLYDYSRSAFAERVGQTPEAPFIAADGQVEQYLEEWDGSKRVRVQRYTPKSVDGMQVPIPQRQNPSDIPEGFARDMQMSEHDIQGALGMYQASLGVRGNATSGVQEREQALKGDVATFHYHDNLARAIRVAGRRIIGAAPKVYDSPRVARILGLDGTASMAHIDPEQPNASQKIGTNLIYNLGVGKYDVAVDVGPSYTTRRQEAAAEMAQLAAHDPQFLSMYGDLYFKMQDTAFASELSARAKFFLPPAVQQAEARGKDQSPEVAQIQAQAQAAIQQREQALMAAHQQLVQTTDELKKLQLQQHSKEGELALKAAALRLEKFQKDAELTYKHWETLFKGDVEIIAAQVSAKRADPSLVAAENKANTDFSGAMTAQPTIPHPTKKPPLDTLMEAHKASDQRHAELQAQIGQHAQLLGQLMQHMAAPRKKTAKAVRQPDGSYVMESTESLQ